MATETIFSSVFTGRLPAVPGGSKVPGPGLKVKYGKFTIGTSEYPVAGYSAADLATICGLTRVEAVVPCGVWMNNSGANGFVASWDGDARTLKAFGNFDGDAAAFVAGAGVEPATIQMAANDASLDGAVLYALVIGY